jgi:hypothetical protein
LNVNKKTIAVLTGTVILPLAAVGCSGGSSKTYSYEVSGVVEAAQVDYECKGDLDMEAASFVVGRAKPKPKKADSGDSSSDSGDNKQEEPAKKNVATPKAPANKAPSKAPASRTPASRSKEPAKSGGVKLSKKPDKPERVTKIKPPKYKHKPKGCHEEYELFVKNREGLFEQDVRKVDYDNCLDKARERFPACTKN